MPALVQGHSCATGISGSLPRLLQEADVVPAWCQRETYPAQIVPEQVLNSGNPSEIFLLLVHITADLTDIGTIDVSLLISLGFWSI